MDIGKVSLVLFFIFHLILGDRTAKRVEGTVTSIPRIHSGFNTFVNVISINYYPSEICEFVKFSVDLLASFTLLFFLNSGDETYFSDYCLKRL